jgi:hypothetical protein
VEEVSGMCNGSLVVFQFASSGELKNIFEKILEQSNSAGEFNIDVELIFGDEPRNMGNNTLVLGMSPPVSKVCNID